jgi:hypothetical protein
MEFCHNRNIEILIIGYILDTLNLKFSLFKGISPVIYVSSQDQSSTSQWGNMSRQPNQDIFGAGVNLFSMETACAIRLSFASIAICALSASASLSDFVWTGSFWVTQRDPPHVSSTISPFQSFLAS